MPLRCPCGCENPEDSLYCNRCGRRLEFQPEGPKTCPLCQHWNPPQVVYCGKCGAGLDDEYAKSVSSGASGPSLVPSDAYISGRPYPLASGTIYSTREQYMIGLVISIPFVILFSLFVIFSEGLLAGIACGVLFLAVLYISWRLGRERAGWGG